jgi:hypothetical protein
MPKLCSSLHQAVVVIIGYVMRRPSTGVTCVMMLLTFVALHLQQTLPAPPTEPETVSMEEEHLPIRYSASHWNCHWKCLNVSRLMSLTLLLLYFHLPPPTAPTEPETVSMEEEHLLTGHTKAVLALVVDEPSGRLYSSSTDATVRAWDMADMACVAVIRGHSKPVTQLQLLGGRLLFTAAGGAVRVWDTQSFVCLAKIRTSFYSGAIRSMLVGSAGGGRAAALGRAGRRIGAYTRQYVFECMCAWARLAQAFSLTPHVPHPRRSSRVPKLIGTIHGCCTAVRFAVCRWSFAWLFSKVKEDWCVCAGWGRVCSACLVPLV